MYSYKMVPLFPKEFPAVPSVTVTLHIRAKTFLELPEGERRFGNKQAPDACSRLLLRGIGKKAHSPLGGSKARQGTSKRPYFHFYTFSFRLINLV